MVNDDVSFYDDAITNLVKQSQKKANNVVVGVTCDEEQKQTYGAVKYNGGFSVRYRAVALGEAIACDTFNANCVLIPYQLFEKTGAMDEHYIHSLGDFDYGLSLKRSGAEIYSSEHFVGVCNRNSIKGTWLDKSLSLKQRIHLKETIKGAPAKQWFYFLKKNFGLTKALVFTVTPYINLVLGR
jgi:GT2 family glycosyltransferase